MRFFGFIKQHNEKIALMLFCIGLFCYALGLSKFYGISAQGFFYVGGFLFCAYHYRYFTWQSLKILALPLVCFAVVLVLGILTIFDEIHFRSTSATLKAINQHILGYLALFVLTFLFAFYAKLAYVRFFLYFFAALCAFEVISTLFLGFKNGFFKGAHNVPFFFKAIFTYNIWLLLPAAIGIAGLFVCKGKYRILSLFAVLLAFIAMLANGERSFIVAFLVMIFVPFFIYPYKHKAIVLTISVCVAAVGFLGFYHISKHLPPRYNFAHLLNNFWVVWQSEPARMGQFDANCFISQKWLICDPKSIEMGKNDITIEHSALSRINMGKSTLLAALDSPFSPHIVGVFQVGQYLWHYYNLHPHLQHNRSYMNMPNGPNHQSNGYNHPHNFAISLLFCYGVIGFISICVFMGFLLYTAYKAMRSYTYYNAHYAESITANALTNLVAMKSFWGLVLGIFVCGICTQSCFDVIYPEILQSIFICFGTLVALGWRESPSGDA